MTLMKVTSQVDSYRLDLGLLCTSHARNSGGVLWCETPGGFPVEAGSKTWESMFVFLKAYYLVSAHPPVSKYIIYTFFSESLEITVFSNLLYLSTSILLYHNCVALFY